MGVERQRQQCRKELNLWVRAVCLRAVLLAFFTCVPEICQVSSALQQLRKELCSAHVVLSSPAARPCSPPVAFQASCT